MYRRTENSPLLGIEPKQNIFRRIPSEITVTSIIVGLFLLVVTLLIVLENKNSPPEEKPDVKNGLLGLSLKSNPDKQWSHDDESTTVDSVENVEDLLSKWRESYEVESSKANHTLEESYIAATNFMRDHFDQIKHWLDKIVQSPDPDSSEDASKVLENVQLLGSSFKNKKKKSDKTWIDGKKWNNINSSDSQQWDDVNKDWKEFFHPESSKKNHTQMESFMNPMNFTKSALDQIKSWLDKWIPSVKKGSWKDTSHSPDDIQLLGSPFKFNKKALDPTWQDKKEWNTPYSYKWDNVNKGWKKPFNPDSSKDVSHRPEDIPLLGSPFKYNKKAFDPTIQDEKEWNKFDAPKSQKWDDVNMDWKRFFNTDSSKDVSHRPEDIPLLGSPFKYNKKAFDPTSQDEKEWNKFDAPNSKKWDDVNKDWKRHFSPDSSKDATHRPEEIQLLGSPLKYNKKALDPTRQDGETWDRFDSPYSQKWDSINKGWKKNFNSDPYSGAIPNSPHSKKEIHGKLLGSPYDYKKKVLVDVETTWKANPAFARTGEMHGYKWDNVNKGWKKDKTYDPMWNYNQDTGRFVDPDTHKWDSVNKGWKKAKNFEPMRTYDQGIEKFVDTDTHKWDSENKGWKKARNDDPMWDNDQDIERFVDTDVPKWDNANKGWIKDKGSDFIRKDKENLDFADVSAYNWDKADRDYKSGKYLLSDLLISARK